jgi:hypothetical protein
MNKEIWTIIKISRRNNYPQMFGPFESQDDANEALKRYQNCPTQEYYDNECSFRVSGPMLPWYGETQIERAKFFLKRGDLPYTFNERTQRFIHNDNKQDSRT